MAQEIVRFTTGSSSNIDSISKSPGKVYFAVDSNNKTGSIYFDKDGTNRIRMSAPKLTQLNVQGEENGVLNIGANSTTGTITLKRNTFVIGSGTTAGQWVGELQYPGVNALYDGFAIDYWINQAGVSSGTTLNLVLSDGTSSGNLPVYYQGTTRLTTHYSVNNIIHLVYRDMTIGNTAYKGWWCQGNYYINDYYRLRLQATAVKAEKNIIAGNIIVGTANGYKHLTDGTSFDINYPILYAGSAINAGSTSDNTYSFIPFAITTTQGISLTANKAVFIKGTLSGSTFTPISTSPLTQTVPTSEDGYFYINLGVAYNGTSMYLLTEHRIMKFLDGAFQEVIYIAQRAYSDSIGNKISQNYVEVGSITTQEVNHKAVYGNGEGTTSWEFALPFVRLSGDTMTGNLTFGNSNIGVRRVGRSMNWNKGRDGALLATTSINGYSPALSIKTTTGSWDIGAYNATGYQEELVFSYVPDTLYNGTNTTPVQIRFQKDGVINGTILKAQKDGLGNIIADTYVAYGSIAVSDTNHQMSYENASGNTQTVSLPFVKRSGDTMSGTLTVSSKVEATGNNKTISLYASTNRGIYDDSNSEWLIYRAADGNTAYIVNKGKTWTFDSSGVLTTPGGATATVNLIGTASRAKYDDQGTLITNYYNASSIDGKILTLTTGGGTSRTLTIDLASWAEGVQIYNGNEITLGSSSTATNPDIWINHKSQKGGTANDSAVAIKNYYFGNRKGATTGVTVHAATFQGNLTGNVTGDITGNAGSADKWKTARNFTIKDYSFSNSGTSVSVNGTANVDLPLPSSIEAQQFIALAGKTGDTTTGIRSSGDLLFENSGTNTRQIRFLVGGNDYARVAAGATASNAGWMEIATADDSNEPIYVRQYTGVFTSLKRTLTLLDASGHTILPGDLKVTTTNTQNLGASGARWKALFVGGADSYGGNTKFIYWLNGVPTAASGTIGSTTVPVWIDAGTIKSITSYSGNAATASNISSTTPTLAVATESNEITVKDLGNSAPESGKAQRHGIDFRWYDSHWMIGNLRTGSTPSAGFGFSYSADGTTYTNEFIIGNDGQLNTKNIKPMTNQTYSIGASGNRYSAVYIGGADSYGGNTKFIYWLNGVPTAASGTIGSASVPVWIDGGTIKAITSYGGNAASATKLATARKINGTNFDGTADITTANWGTARTITIGDTGKSVNGSANVSWNKNEILGGSGTTTFLRADKTWSNVLTGGLTVASLDISGAGLITFADSGSWGSSSATFPNARGGIYWAGTSDWVKLFGEETSSDNFNLIADFGDDASPSFILRDRGTSKIWLTPSSGTITATTFSGNATTATALTSNAGSTTQPIYFSGGKPVATSYALKATVNNSTAQYMAYYSGANAISGTSYVQHLNHVAASKAGYIDGLLITGSAYGEAANLTSGVEGQVTYGDAGPQIRFNSGGQTGAIIADHYDSTSGAGFSFNFVSNQSSTAIKSTHGVFQQRLAVGQNSTDGTYVLKVEGQSFLNGLTKVGTTNAGALGIGQTNGTGLGISLYGGPNNGVPTYGLMFALTGNQGKFGDVQGDWATYFTMDNSSSLRRGWIFKQNSGTGTDNMAASISRRGVGTFKGLANHESWVQFPDGGSYHTIASTVTGALKIKLPHYKTNCMMSFEVRIFTYTSNPTIATYVIGGYEYGDTGWYHPASKVYTIGTGPYKNLKVRFGYDGSSACVTIGETNTAWSYPQVSISNITLGYSDYTSADWARGWEISFITTLPSSISGEIENPSNSQDGTADRVAYYKTDKSITSANSLYTNGSYLALINDSSNSTYDALLYIQNHGSADWAQITDIGTANYGLYIRGTGSHLLQVGTDDIFHVNGSKEVSIKGTLNLNRASNNAYGRIKFYNNSYTTWVDYMSDAANSAAPTGGKPSQLGNVTSWARRTIIENAAGYGWIWEGTANGAASAADIQPTARMALSSNTGALRIAPNVSSAANESSGLIIDSAKNGSSGNVAIELWRGSNASWQFANESGTLYIRNNYTSSRQTSYTQNSLILDYNTGAGSIPYFAIGQTGRNTSYKLYVNGNSYFNGNISVSGLINNFKLVSGGTLNADDVRTTNGIWVIPAAITNAAVSNHGALIGIANVGTPSQLYIPDSSHRYIYKRYYSGGAWSGWFKIDAGHADTAGTFSSNATVTLTGDTTGTSAGSTKSWTVATTTNKLTNTDITVKTNSSASQSHISTETFINWLITQGYIPNKISCTRILKCSWSYAGNDILQIAYDGKNYEIQLAGCIIEFKGYVNSTYANGDNVYRLIIRTSPTNSFTAASGYIKVPTSSDWEYSCNGSGYNPVWRCTSHVLDYNTGAITRFGYGTSGMTSTSWLACWDGYNLRALNPTNNNIGALTAHRPLGFTSDSQSSASWGNQTGTGVTTWNDSSGGSIEFRKDNPSSGKLSVKVDGRFYGNEGNNPAMLMNEANGYWGMGNPDGANNVWIRTTTAGILPYQSGSIGAGHQSLGTSSWFFSSGYIDTIHSHQLIVEGATNATMSSATTNPRITFQEGTGTQPVHLVYCDYDNYRAPAGLKVVGGTNATPAWFETEGDFYTEAGVYQKVRVIQGLNSDTAGWKRCCKIYARYNYGNCIVMFSGGWNNGAPTMATISIQLRNGQAHIKVLHTGFTGRITDVRVVKTDEATNEYWLDVYLVATTGATADLYATFIGNIIVTDIKDGQPAASGTAASSVNINATTITEGTRTGTASRVAYYSTANRVNSAANLVTDGNYLSNITYLTVNAAHQTEYRFKVNGEGYATKFWNAVWNDYAEHRKTIKDVKFGQVVYEDGTGQQHITKHRLTPGCNITSDTFGTSMGKRPDCETPIAVAGRVLAYINESKDNYAPGDAVCSGPNGTVSKMTRKEIKRYPDAIIGYVSEIPDYDIWYAGNEEDPIEIKVDNRIWIKVN